jgi:hypothetical protein
MRKIAPFILLVLFSLYLGVWFERYRAIGPQLLPPLQNVEASALQLSSDSGTIVLESADVVRLHSGDPLKSLILRYRIELPLCHSLLRLSADLKTENVMAGKKGWQKARLVLSSRDGNGKRLPDDHQVVVLEGDNPWRHYAEVFSISSQAAETRVELQLAKASGTLWGKDLSLQKVEIVPFFHYGRYALFLLWGLFLLWLLIPVVAVKFCYLSQAGLFVVLAVTLGGIFLPGDLKQETLVWLKEWLHTFFDFSPSFAAEAEIGGFERLFWFNVTKVMHFLLFALLALMLSFSGTKRRTHLLFDLWMLAAATELLQLFIPGRTAQLTDWLIDGAGIVLGLWLAGIWASRRNLGSNGIVAPDLR